MRLKDMFTVPQGQKVTEKLFFRVLTTSICSIILCMSCLASTTWALFSVSIENTGNVIQIGEPAVVLTVDDGEFTSGAELTADSHTVRIANANQNVDDFQRKSTLYVTMTIQTEDEAINVYAAVKQDQEFVTVEIKGAKGCIFTWEVSWFAPVNAIELIGDEIVVETNEPTEETTESTETDPSEESSEPTETDPSEESSEPTETDPSEESSEPTETDPSEESSEPTETDPSEESSEPTETDPSEESSEPTETDPSEESSEPTETDPSEESSEPTETDPSEESSEPAETATTDESAT